LRGDAAALRRLEGDRGSGFLTAHSGVLDLLQDHEGGLWVALLTQGLAYLPPDWRRFSIWNQLDGKPLDSQYLLSAASDGKNYYVGSRAGCTSWMRRAPCACWPATGSSAAAWCGRCCRARMGACGWGARPHHRLRSGYRRAARSADRWQCRPAPAHRPDAAGA
jgi:hypothetical protein